MGRPRMKILVTGSAGFVGQATLAELGEHEVIEYDLMGGYDIRDEKQLGMVVAENLPDRILHLAAIARFADADKDPLQAHATNVLGTKNVAKVASRYHVPLVYASTGSVYMPISEAPPITEDFKVAGNSIYAVTKLMGELYVRQSRSPWMILRYAHLYGVEKRGHGLIGGFIERIERGLAPTLYGGRQSNDFTYIADVARANRLALEASYDRWGEVYNIGTGEELTAEDAGRMVCDAWGYSGDTLVIPARSVDPERFVYDTAKATRMLGFTAEYSFKMGMAEMARTDGAYAPIQVA
jgi:UDP-glucose 4-epimerase